MCECWGDGCAWDCIFIMQEDLLCRACIGLYSSECGCIYIFITLHVCLGRVCLGLNIPSAALPTITRSKADLNTFMILAPDLDIGSKFPLVWLITYIRST